MPTLWSSQFVQEIATAKEFPIAPHKSIQPLFGADGGVTIRATNQDGIVTLSASGGRVNAHVTIQQFPLNCGALIASSTDSWYSEDELHLKDFLIKNFASMLGDRTVAISGHLPKVEGYTKKCEWWTMGLETTSSRKHYGQKMGYALLEIPKEMMKRSGYH